MNYLPQKPRYIAEAQITDFAVTLDSLTYSMKIFNCVIESEYQVVDVPDFEITHKISFANSIQMIGWMNDPIFGLIQQSWMSEEKNCYFEKWLDDCVALMTLMGTIVLIPVKTKKVQS